MNFDVKTSYVVFRLFRWGSENFRALPFSRNVSAADVLMTRWNVFNLIGRSDLAEDILERYFFRAGRIFYGGNIFGLMIFIQSFRKTLKIIFPLKV